MGIITMVIAGLLLIIFQLVKPSVSLNHVLISRADVGAVENSFATNGMVEPRYQEMLTATLSADVLEINLHPGDMVQAGDTIIVPDIAMLRNLEKNIEHEIALKKNRIERSQEEIRSRREQLKRNLKKDSIRIRHLVAALEKEKYLLEIGGGSQQKVEQAQIEYQLASIASENQQSEFASFKTLQRLDLESMELELALKYQERDKILNRINKAFVKSKINGVLTSVLVEPGQHVSEGQAVAHVADANNFKISGSISSRYANKIFPGQKAHIIVNESVLHGQLVSMSPAVDNGSINYSVRLNSPSHPMLRAKMKVEVRLIESVNPVTVRIANGDYYYGPGKTELFIRKDNRLEKRTVQLGGANFDYVEVVSGISKGESVVVSNSFTQKHLRYNSLSCTD